MPGDAIKLIGCPEYTQSLRPFPCYRRRLAPSRQKHHRGLTISLSSSPSRVAALLPGLRQTGNIQLLDSAPGFVDLERELVQFQPSGEQWEHDDLAMAVWQAAKDYPALLRAAV